LNAVARERKLAFVERRLELAKDKMELTEEQKQKVAKWIEEGLKPFEIQTRLEKECGLRLTFMEVKLLLSELNLAPKDEDPEPAPAAGAAVPPAGGPDAPAEQTRPGDVSVSVDRVTRAGAVLSGRVRFSDGKEAVWYVDRTGQLGLTPPEPGYRPPPGDISEFQKALDRELARMGM